MAHWTKKQRWLVVGAPLAVLMMSACVYPLNGIVAVLLAVASIGGYLGYLLVEARHHQQGLFVRGLDEQRAIYGQLEAIIGLNHALSPRFPFPATRGWAASPDLLREVVNHVLTSEVALAVEASSGTSTLMIACAMERKGTGRVIALEHDELYAGRTRALLEQHGLQHRAAVVHAPLVEHRTDKGVLLWYDLSKAAITAPIDLLVVDGPPEEVHALARYPALPLLHRSLAKGARVILDDGARADERVIAQRWKSEYGASDLEYMWMEKGAWSLRF
jgi:predicted O-methyltransferase YrrM